MITAAGRLLILAAKQLFRHRVRMLLTLAGIGAGLFLFTVVESLQRSVREATEVQASDTTLVVYRENRFCPATSQLPEFYENEIRQIPGVREVIPIKITVNNCGASLDVITFRGVPEDQLLRYAPEIDIIEGDLESWKARGDGALLGKHFATRRGLSPGDAFEAAGVRVVVSGILDSPHPQDNEVAYVHLPFLQQASRRGLGEVTQFNVRVEQADLLQPVASAIDDRFRSEAWPTQTHPEKAFFAQTAGELIGLVGYTRWIGVGAVAAVFGLVANALMLAVRGRVREHAVLATLGFPAAALSWLVLAEGVLMGVGGGALGLILSAAFFSWRPMTLGSEGLALGVQMDGMVLVTGMGIALLLGAVASAWPAFLAVRRPIVEALRS